MSDGSSNARADHGSEGDIGTHPVVSRREWVAARRELLVREKALTRLRDDVAEAQRAMPWTRVEKEYVFDSASGPLTFAELFDGRRQLFVKHFMLAPGQQTQCRGCSLEVDHVAGLLEHLHSNGVTYAAIARAPIDEIESVRKRMGWRFPWVSSFGSDFNFDFHVSFTPEQVASGDAMYNWSEGAKVPGEMSGDSVFFKADDGQIYHTWSAFGRGCEEFVGIYRFLDVMPLGRREHGPTFSMMDWVQLRRPEREE